MNWTETKRRTIFFQPWGHLLGIKEQKETAWNTWPKGEAIVSLDSVLEELVFGEETRELSTVTGVSDKMLLNKLSKRMADKNQAVFYFLKLLKGQGSINLSCWFFNAHLTWHLTWQTSELNDNRTVHMWKTCLRKSNTKSLLGHDLEQRNVKPVS